MPIRSTILARCFSASFLLFLSRLGLLVSSPLLAAPYTAIPVNRTDYQIWKGQRQLLTIQTRVVGPGWSQAAFETMASAGDGRRAFSETARFPKAGGGAPQMPFVYEATQPAPTQLAIRTETSSAEPADGIGTAIIVSTSDWFAGGQGVAVQSDGSEMTFQMPVGMGKYGEAVKEIRLTAKDGSTMTIGASSPVSVTTDRGELRIWTWERRLEAGKPAEATLVFGLPGEVDVEFANRLLDLSGWFPFRPRQDFAPGSPIGAEAFLDAPAGKHGWVQIDGQHFVFEKKKEPFKFWGTNIAYSRMAVEPELAVEWADKFAKYGINIVRYHKWTGNNGWDGVMSPEDALEFDEVASRKFDQIHAEMKTRGIYAGWSPIFVLKLHDSMAKSLKHYDEIQAGVPKRKGMFANSLYPLQTISEEVQDFYIALTVKWLNRKNEFTGLRYADDPAVAYVELHNEADIFFFGTGALLRTYPSYTRLLNERFAEWLRKRYAGDKELKAAWGGDLKREESLENSTVFPFPNYNGQLPPPRRVVDSYTFLFEFQNSFYDRYIEAIRKTGYQGAIVGGCWQASDMYGHLWNLASDRQAGFIDRHNYFRGERPMVTEPGSALLSAGMQQVGDRPFGLTEWAASHVFSAETQPILGLIGLGLGGWDYSAQFASASPIVISDNNGEINGNFDEWRATGQHPFIARFLYSGALKEGTVVASRRISLQQLHEGVIPFEERFSLLGGANLKNFAGAAPNEALGVGRVIIDFVDKPVEPAVDLSQLDAYWDKTNLVLQGSNGQTRWDYAERGFLTVDTDTADAVIGFGGGRRHDLGEVEIEYDNAFANVYVAAQKPGEALADAKRWVILTMARTANQGDVLEETSMEYLSRSRRESRARTAAEKRADYLANPRLMIEPVAAAFTVKRKSPFKVYALDHDGCLPEGATPLPVEETPEGHRFRVDGAQTGAVYYLVEFGG